MTITTTTLPDRAAAHAIERAHLRALREAIQERLRRDLAALEAVGIPMPLPADPGALRAMGGAA